MHEEFKIGLTLSGGGAKGAAHIGVIKAMEELGLQADIVSGTSAGSIIGSLYCSGYKAEEMLDLFLNTSIFRPRNYTWKKPGLINTGALGKILEPLFPEDSFEKLNYPMHIVATDLLKARQKVFSQGPIIQAMLASCSFPFIFAPMEIDEALYADGGILNNFPVELIRPNCEKLIGVNVQHIRPVERSSLKSSFSVVQRVFSISTRLQSVSKYHNCDIVISPEELAMYNTFDMYKIRKMYEIGYAEAMKELDGFDSEAK